MMCRYELYAVICHSGTSLSSGHYISYVRAPPANAAMASLEVGDGTDGSDTEPVWFICNDDVVTALKETDLKQKLSVVGATTPYMLFYRRISAWVFREIRRIFRWLYVFVQVRFAKVAILWCFVFCRRGILCSLKSVGIYWICVCVCLLLITVACLRNSWPLRALKARAVPNTLFVFYLVQIVNSYLVGIPNTNSCRQPTNCCSACVCQ